MAATARPPQSALLSPRFEHSDVNVSLATEIVPKDGSPPYTVYMIQATFKDGVQLCHRRYSEFLELRETLRRKFPKMTEPSFPGKRLWHTQGVINNRVVKFDAWLKALLQQKRIRRSRTFTKFLTSNPVPIDNWDVDYLPTMSPRCRPDNDGPVRSAWDGF